jgi:site-specific recombinase XerD
MENKDGIIIDEAYKLFKEELANKNYSSSTILAYQTDIQQLCQFLKQEGLNSMSQVTSQDIVKFQDSLNKKKYLPVSLARKLNAFRSFFNFCHRQNLMTHNPAGQIISPKFDKPAPRILSRMEYRALRDTCRNNPRTAALIEIFIQTGLKVSEVAKLKTEDVKKDRLIITSGKNQREIPLTSSAQKALEKYLKVRPNSKNPQVFITKNGTPLLIRNMSTILKRCFREAEIKNASLNSLRHTWIYHQLASGLPLQTVSQLVGHKRISSTAIYLSLIDNQKITARNQIKEL